MIDWAEVGSTAGVILAFSLLLTGGISHRDRFPKARGVIVPSIVGIAFMAMLLFFELHGVQFVGPGGHGGVSLP